MNCGRRKKKVEKRRSSVSFRRYSITDDQWCLSGEIAYQCTNNFRGGMWYIKKMADKSSRSMIRDTSVSVACTFKTFQN